MRFQCLGPLTIQTELSETVVGNSRRARLLVALLANAGDVVYSERLVQELWDNEPPNHTENALHAQVARLRRDLDGWGCGGDRLRTRFPGYALDLDGVDLDIRTFLELADRAERVRPTDPATSGGLARRALAMWRGSPFACLHVGLIGQISRARLEERRLQVQEGLVDAQLRTGSHGELIADLQELVLSHPFRERFHEQLMLALYRSGRQAEALEVYRRARERLCNDLGVEPSPLLTRRFTALLQQAPEMAWSPEPLLAAAS